MMGWGYGNYAMGWLGPMTMLLFWGVIIGGIVFLVRGFTRPGNDGGKGDTALDILKKRYARGELDREEFEKMRKDLRLE